MVDCSFGVLWRLSSLPKVEFARFRGGGTMRTVISTFAALLVGAVIYDNSAYAQRSPTADDKAARIALVQEFVREVQVLYGLQQLAKKELAEDSSNNGQLATAVRMGTRTRLEMDDNINRLNLIAI